MATMLEDFLKEHGIEPAQVIGASNQLEQYNDKTRELVVAREDARRAKKTYAELELGKPDRYGRGVSPDTMRRALAGEPLPRIARKKIIRAVNANLASQKKDPIEWRQLFADVRRKSGKKS